MNRFFLLVALALSGLALAARSGKRKIDSDGILDEDATDRFDSFKSKFKRNCTDGTTACKQRKRNYAKNLKRLKELNETTNGDYEVEENKFMDWSDDDMKKMVFPIDGMPKPQTDNLDLSDPVQLRNKRAAAANFDWRTTTAVNPIRNQGSCGSCWAFASVAALETQMNYKNNRTGALRRSYSEQTLEKPVSAVSIFTGNVSQTVTFIKNQGPVTACFYVCNSFYAYASGVKMTRPSVLLFLGLATVALGSFGSDLDGVLDGDVLQQFQEFLNSFNKTCDPGSADCLQRQKNFANNLEQLKKFSNSSDDGAEFGMNHFMDWSPEEMKRMTFNHESTGPTADAPSAGAIRAKRQSVPGPVYEEEVVLLDADFLDPFFAFFQQDDERH
ncbi:unnamed protein product, partial [Mesorhabditis spiculigera]